MSLHTSGGPGGGQTFSLNLIPAPELPKTTADLRGMITSVQNNSIYIAQADKMMFAVQANGQVAAPTPSGPSTEVVVSKDTKIYRDTTMDNMPKPSGNSSPDKPQQIQQTLQLVDISAVTAGNGAAAQVWGQRRGDRINADIIVITAPIVAKPGGGK